MTYNNLDFDDLDFEEIMEFVRKRPNAVTSIGVRQWAASKGYQLNKEQFDKITLITLGLK